MKEEILDITKKLYHNHLTPETATNLLLDLFAVSGSLLDDKWKQYRNITNNEDAWCFKEWLKSNDR
jgi:hypothetical protein